MLVVRDVNATVNSNSGFDTYELDIDQNGSIDFTFNASHLDGFLSQAYITTNDTSAFVVDATFFGFPDVSLLGGGAMVSDNSLFSQPPSDQGNLANFNILDGASGNFLGQAGSVGVRFMGGSGTLYGYAQVAVDGPNADNPYSIRIGRVAYQTDGTGIEVPEPGSLALLGAAGVGFLATRRRRPAGSVSPVRD